MVTRASRSKRCQQAIPLTSTSSSDLMDAIAVSVLIASSAQLRVASPRQWSCGPSFFGTQAHRSTLTSSICPENHCRNQAKSLIRSREYSSRTEGPIVVLGVVSRVLRQCLQGTALHLSRKEGASRGRRICSSRPQLLDQPFSHADLFLLSFGVCLQGRHSCFQPRDRVNELLVLLLCQTHSSHGFHHNSSSRTVQRSIRSATIME